MWERFHDSFYFDSKLLFLETDPNSKLKYIFQVKDFCKTWEGVIDKLERGMKMNQKNQAVFRHSLKTRN